MQKSGINKLKKMNKKTKIYLGFGVLAVAAYYFLNKSKSTQANASGKIYVQGGNVPCVYLDGSELIDGKTSSYDPNICVSKAGKGLKYSEKHSEWKYQ
jgi:hypothetical protein